VVSVALVVLVISLVSVLERVEDFKNTEERISFVFLTIDVDGLLPLLLLEVLISVGRLMQIIVINGISQKKHIINNHSNNENIYTCQRLFVVALVYKCNCYYFD